MDKIETTVLVLGGGMAGMSAALILARSMIKCSVINDESAGRTQDNFTHNFITRDGLKKSEILQKAKSDLSPYETACYLDDRAVRVEKNTSGYQVHCQSGQIVTAKKLIFSPGLSFDISAMGLEGLEDIWGTSLFTCPYCHAYEYAHKNITVLGRSEQDFDFLRLMTNWSDKVHFLTHGQPFSDKAKQQFSHLSQGELREEKITKIVHDSGHVKEIVLASGESLKTDVVFVPDMHSHPHDLIESLKIRKVMNPQLRKMTYETDPVGRTKLNDVFIVGDARTGFSTLVGAAHEGVIAGVMLINDLVDQKTRAQLSP